MSTSIAFLSGKGGSGKTTLALSIADLLCRCGVRTLLVDCDLSTNGATYFYESRLSSNMTSFCNILREEWVEKKPLFLEVSKNLFFVPSISEITDQIPSVQWSSWAVGNRLRQFKIFAERNFDVVLFDCQAGYTDLLPILLPLMDVDLFVLEADSISASSMRSLHLKIGSIVGSAKLYQVFNKATPEEYEIYSKIVGTFFTNIGTLLFDWKIRQAFSRSQVPDLENTSAEYGQNICDICKIIFTDTITRANLDLFSNKLQVHRLNEKRKQIEEELHQTIAKRDRFGLSSSVVLATLFVTISAAILSILTESLTIDSEVSEEFVSIAILTAVVIGLFSLVTFFVADRFKDVRRSRQKYERELTEIENTLRTINKSQPNRDK